MFEPIFRESLARLAEDVLIDKLWNEIKRSYSRPGRHYHNLTHLDNLVGELIPVKQEIQDWPTLIFSIAYHDSVYNVLKKDNEEKSATLACKRLTELGIPAAQKEKCKTQILATKTHLRSDDADTNLLTDADLSILGADPAIYRIYTAQIRKEYRYYPDFLYNPGRKKVLEHFLNMPVIYKTDYFAKKYEGPARVNITQELKSIS